MTSSEVGNSSAWPSDIGHLSCGYGEPETLRWSVFPTSQSHCLIPPYLPRYADRKESTFLVPMRKDSDWYGLDHNIDQGSGMF